jgi:CBS domain-containing protein
MKIREIMRPSFLTLVHRTAPVSDAIRAMVDHNVSIVAVVDDVALVGVFSERDVVRRVVHRGLDPGRTRLEQVMTTGLVVGYPDEPCESAMRKMDHAGIRHLPIVADGQLVAMLSVRDLLRAEIADSAIEREYLRAYLYQVPTEFQVGRLIEQ